MRYGMKIICALVCVSMCVSSIGLAIALAPGDDKEGAGISAGAGLLLKPAASMMPLKEPLKVDDDIKERLDELVGAGIHSVGPSDVPADILRYVPVRASAHNEPDHEGIHYNNNVSSAEYIDISGGAVTYDGSTGDQPRLWVNWSADKENPAYGNGFADTDFYYVSLGESASSIDFINVTITCDYGTDHSGTSSNKDFGAEITVLTGHEWIEDVQGNLIKSRPVWWSGLGVGYADDLLDSWTGDYGAMYNSLHFSPPYSGDFYLWVAPYNMSLSPDMTVEEVWYNMSVTYTTKGTSGSFTHGKSATSDIKDSVGTMTLASDGCTGKGYQDVLGNVPARDSNLRRVNASSYPSSLPENKHFISEMLDYNDWYNASGKLLGDPNGSEDVNASVEIYDSFVIAIDGGLQMGTILIWSAVFIEVWQHDPVEDMFWFSRSWGAGYILFQDESSNPWDWTEPYCALKTNDTTDMLSIRVWTDTLIWIEKDPNGGIYYGGSGMDFFDSWGYYNLTALEVKKHVPDTPPVLSDGSVIPGRGSSAQAYTYTVTYSDANDEPPAIINVNIDGTLHTMSKNTSSTKAGLSDGDYTNGEEYVYVHPANSFPLDKHKVSQFSFYAKDPDNMAATGDINLKTGPTIDNNFKPYTTGTYPDNVIMNEDSYNVGVSTYYLNMSSKFSDGETPYELTYKLRPMVTDPWASAFDSDLIAIALNSNNTMSINTKPDSVGQVTLLFNATDPGGLWVAPATGVTFNVIGINDPPVIQKIAYGGLDIPVVDHAASVTASEDSWCNLTLFASDIDGVDTLSFWVENAGTSDALAGSDVITKALDAFSYTGDIAYLPVNRDVGVMTANISVSDSEVKDCVMVTITVVNVNDAPELVPIKQMSVYQYEWLNVTMTAKDVDLDTPGSSEGLTFSCNMSDSMPDAKKGKVWDLVPASATSATFSLHPESQDLIGLGVDQKDYYVQFKATDKDGKTAVQCVKITVKDRNDLPVASEDTFALIVNGSAYESGPTGSNVISVVAPEITDIDGDEIVCEWSFGDMTISAAGASAQHEYKENGNYTIMLRFSDGGSEPIEMQRNVWVYVESTPPPPPPDDDYNVTDPPPPPEPEPTIWEEYGIYLGIVLAIIIIIIVIVIIVVVLRGRRDEDVTESLPEPTSAQGQSAMPGGSAPEPAPEPMPEPAGLEPMPEPMGLSITSEPQSLPESEAPLELPPGPEGIEEQSAPVGTEPGMAAPGEPATLETPAQQAPEQGLNNCPTCGSAVRPGWFLCPVCKNPLS